MTAKEHGKGVVHFKISNKSSDVDPYLFFRRTVTTLSTRVTVTTHFQNVSSCGVSLRYAISNNIVKVAVPGNDDKDGHRVSWAVTSVREFDTISCFNGLNTGFLNGTQRMQSIGQP